MPIHVTNTEAEVLTREFARMAGIGITDAAIMAMTEAIERRHAHETPRENAARLRATHGITASDAARIPLRRQTFDEMWGDC